MIKSAGKGFRLEDGKTIVPIAKFKLELDGYHAPLTAGIVLYYIVLYCTVLYCTSCDNHLQFSFPIFVFIYAFFIFLMSFILFCFFFSFFHFSFFNS